MIACSSPENSRISLQYGHSRVTLALTGAASVETLQGNPMPVVEDLPAAFARAIGDEAIGQPLCARVRRGDRVTIVISDLTRFWMRQDRVCELLVRWLEAQGIADSDICVLVALGTHRKSTPEELAKLASAYVYARVRVVNHDCDAPDLVDVGRTPLGNRVMVNPLAVGRKVIVISGTVHHLMAGYGGGRKSILPGICGRESIRFNHEHALDPDAPRSSERVGSGHLADNPIDADMRAAAALVGPVFGISIAVDAQMQPSALFAGDFEAAWTQSCAYCQKYYGLPIAHDYDVVIASCGGYPRDLNLYQGVKTLLNGAHALKPGGDFVFLCQCPEGGGARDFFDWIEPLGRGALDRELRKNFTIAGYIFYASCEAIARAGSFRMLSDMDAESVRGMGIRAFSDPAALLSGLDLTGKSVCVIPNGGSLLPQLPAEYARLNREVGT